MVKRIGFVACIAVCVCWSGIAGLAWRSQASPRIGVPNEPSSVGYLNLTKRHPDGNEGPTEFDTAYDVGPALQRLDQMRGFLVSFKRLTAQARGRVKAADLRAAGNTGGEIQSLGFHNIPLVVEGTLLKQDYQLKQLEYEMAQLRRIRGEVADAEVERARDAYAAATKRFQLYWDTKRPID